jgi:hypothetical protein
MANVGLIVFSRLAINIKSNGMRRLDYSKPAPHIINSNPLRCWADGQQETPHTGRNRWKIQVKQLSNHETNHRTAD